MSDAKKPDRRSSTRIAVEMWVEGSTERALYFQQSANISVGGIFLEGTIPDAKKGTVVTLQFTLPNDTSPINVKGEIVSVTEASELGIGIKFLDLADSDRERIRAFIERAS